eukprot:395887-Ditylum_brightwellii.AAC.1
MQFGKALRCLLLHTVHVNPILGPVQMQKSTLAMPTCRCGSALKTSPPWLLLSPQSLEKCPSLAFTSCYQWATS